MITKGLILLIITLLCGVIVLAAIAWTLIKWNNKKSRGTGCLTALLFVILTFMSGGYLVYKGVDTIIEKVPEIKEKSINAINDAISKYPDSPFIDSLKNMQPENTIIPQTFLTYGGVWDHFRMPLIHPYSLNSIDLLDYAHIKDEKGIENIEKDVSKGVALFSDITLFSFDKNILLAKTRKESNDEVKYILFQFKTGQSEEYSSRSEMNHQAYQLGFDTVKPMMTVKDYYYKFFTCE